MLYDVVAYSSRPHDVTSRRHICVRLQSQVTALSRYQNRWRRRKISDRPKIHIIWKMPGMCCAAGCDSEVYFIVQLMLTRSYHYAMLNDVNANTDRAHCGCCSDMCVLIDVSNLTGFAAVWFSCVFDGGFWTSNTRLFYF